jgi:hypothetical protein
LLPRKLHANSRLWLKTYSDLYCKSSTNNHRCNYYMENKMTSLKTYLCVLKIFDAKIYLWHLQAFLISGAKIKKYKLHSNWSLTTIPWSNIWYIVVTWDEQCHPDINSDIRPRLFISCDSYVPCCEMELQWAPRSPLILRKYTMVTYNYQ